MQYIRHKKTIPTLVTVLIFIVVATSCVGLFNTRVTKDSPTKEKTIANTKISCRFLSETVLEREYGRDYNPFIPYYSLITPKDFVVFELDFPAGTPMLTLDLDRAVLKFGSLGSYGIVKQRNLLRYWDQWDQEQIDNGKPTKGHIKIKRDRLIKDLVLDGEVKNIRSIHGYVIFDGNPPEEGEAQVIIPVRGVGGSTELIFDYEFVFDKN
jgi:hypothetical protein